MIIFFNIQLHKLAHLLPINTDNPLFTFAFSNKTSWELWSSSQPSWLQCTSTLLLDSLYFNQFGVMRLPVLPVVTLLIYYLCHFYAICHRKRWKHQRWILHETSHRCVCALNTEYNVFNAMFWGLLKCVSPTIWFNLCECGCVYLLPRSPTPPVAYPSLWVHGPAPLVSVSLLHPRVCVSLCSHSNLAPLQGEECVCVF